MDQPVTIFIAGIGGVFIGMALLYISIKTTSFIADGLTNKKEKND